MDDGYVIPGLNENWTFAGAKPMEWASGLVAMILVNEFFVSNMGRSMPLLLMVLVLVPIGLATLRKAYPDEERGLRNHLMSILGVAPPDIPPPALLQPTWSGLPMREMPEARLFMQLGLDLLINQEDDETNAIYKNPYQM
ncbi:MAG: hypothetical protein KDD62_07755 [Bdellovibrionales bacterium]|nr:hypothetical protein [Bdellovibrionales bacterium]